MMLPFLSLRWGMNQRRTSVHIKNQLVGTSGPKGLSRLRRDRKMKLIVKNYDLYFMLIPVVLF